MQVDRIQQTEFLDARNKSCELVAREQWEKFGCRVKFEFGFAIFCHELRVLSASASESNGGLQTQLAIIV